MIFKHISYPIQLRKMVVKHNSLSVTAFRNNAWSEIESSQLIPGDRIQVQVQIDLTY